MAALADPILMVDQEQIASGFNANLGIFAPIGQTFTPTLSGLDAVELRMSDSAGFPGNVFVRVRAGSTVGSILGTSLTTSLPDGGAGILHFDFVSTVPLTPGSLYVIENVLESGSSNVHWNGQFANPYLGGTSIFEGESLDSSDMWFREGLHTAVPEPSSILLVCITLGAFISYTRFRRLTLAL
jgi:hypothetical protein